MNYLFKILLLFCIIFSTLNGNGQTILTVKDTLIKTEPKAKTTEEAKVLNHPPRKAAIMSAVIPGLGQAYNKKIWKIPIIYGCFTALVYAVQFNKTEYNRYFNEYVARLKNDSINIDPLLYAYSNDNLRSVFEYRQRYRDLSYIGIAAVYLLNIVDASVDAHLFYFNVSDDLSLTVMPKVFYASRTKKPFTGLSLTFNL